MTTETKQQPAPRWYKIAVALIVIAFAILNGVTLGNKSLWIDEMQTGYAMFQFPYSQFIHYIILNDPAAPLYNIIVYAFSNEKHYSEFLLRLPSLLFAIGAIFAFSTLSRKILQDNITSFIAMLIFVCSTNMAYFSQEARPYSLFLLLSILAYSFAIELANNGTRFVTFTLICIIGVYVHILFSVVVLTCFLFAVFFNIHNIQGRNKILIGTLITGIIFLPWLFTMLHVSADPSRTPDVSMGALKTIVVLFAGLLTGNAYAGIRIGAFSAVAAFILSFAGLLSCGSLKPRTRRFLLYCTFVPVLLFFSLSLMFHNVYNFFHFRYLIQILPFLTIVMAAGVVSFFRKNLFYRHISIDIKDCVGSNETNSCASYSIYPREYLKAKWISPFGVFRVLFVFFIIGFVCCNTINISHYYKTQHQNWRGAWDYMHHRQTNDYPAYVLLNIASPSMGYYIMESIPMRMCNSEKGTMPFKFSTNRISDTTNIFSTFHDKWVVYYRANWNIKSPDFDKTYRMIDEMTTEKRVFPGLYGDIVVGYSNRHTLINRLKLSLKHSMEPSSRFYPFMTRSYPECKVDRNGRSFYPVPSHISQKYDFFENKKTDNIPCFNVRSGKFRLNINVHRGESLYVSQNNIFKKYTFSGVYHLYLKRGPFLVGILHPNSEGRYSDIQIIRSKPIKLIDQGTGPEYGHYFLDWIRE